MKRILFITFSVWWLLATNTSWPQEKPAAPDTEKSVEADSSVTAPERPQRPADNTPRPHIPASEESAMALLADQLPKDALLWLETEDERFLSLWQRDRSGDPKGAVLIIHAEGEHPAWPKTTKPLHDSLPDYGWATLAISLPPPDQKPIPERTFPVKAIPIIAADNEPEENENTEVSDTDNNETQESEDNSKKSAQKVPATISKTLLNEKKATETITEKRLESALKFLHDRGQFNLILLGSGAGAIRAQQFLDKITPQVTNPKLKAKLEKPVRALVLINGRNSLPTMDSNYTNWFNDPEIPVLDIFVQTDNRNLAEANYRKTLARQRRVIAYKQVRLTELNTENNWGENRLSRRVRSFLDSNAVGIEVKNARLKRE